MPVVQLAARRAAPAVSAGPAIAGAGCGPHALHGPDRSWPETNCSVDLWIELLGALGREPAAAMAFAVTQDFEGDQFTFFKIPAEDLERLYGLTLLELSVFDRLESHVAEQLGRGRVVLVEADGFWLPDTQGVSYRTEHTKTTIGINRLDEGARTLEYFHNAGYFRLQGEDFDGVFNRLPGQRSDATMFPYVEFVKLDQPALDEARLRAAAKDLLYRHLERAPSSNPVEAWRPRLSGQLQALADRDHNAFHKYAFNTARQLGANFELLASFLDWLAPGEGSPYAEQRAAALRIAHGAKTLQFNMARAVARGRHDGLNPHLDALASDWEACVPALAATLGA
ncbi:DUF1839 domain-containing protein [Alsobacter soli]|uniref:DUF1839 domain-containing protein n=2 Tax=Alsobacter soli TaxID=2109933 RepID=A0A2T1HYM2_9HYPH|nr:DUF1839 domain-containing protein [Alsobacter soli]